MREAGGAVTAFLGGILFLVLTLTLDYIETRWGSTLPKEVTVGTGIVLMVWGQFWAYHKLRIRHEKPQPRIDERLELLEEAPALTPHEHPISREIAEKLGAQHSPSPEHQLLVHLGARAEIDPPALTVEATVPIYESSAFVRRPGEEDSTMTLESINRRQERRTIPFGDRALPPGTRFLLVLNSPVPIRLKAVSVAERRLGPPGAGTAKS